MILRCRNDVDNVGQYQQLLPSFLSHCNVNPEASGPAVNATSGEPNEFSLLPLRNIQNIFFSLLYRHPLLDLLPYTAIQTKFKGSEVNVGPLNFFSFTSSRNNI